jgi:hypothetical protein
MPEVFTRVSSVVDWVKSTVCQRVGELCQEEKMLSTEGPGPFVIFLASKTDKDVRGPFDKAGKQVRGM